MIVSARQAQIYAHEHDTRLGQALFNILPERVQRIVRDTSFDPFYKNMREIDLYFWISDHLVFESDEIIAVFDGDNLIWESTNETR